MSEYQYYEFQAVDRCLTDKEMNELRAFSTRAQITPNSFVNEYTFGSFKGNPSLWMEKYFDGFLHYANWGTHILQLRLPSAILDLKTAQAYCNGECFSVRLSNDKIILDFLSEDENGEWEEGLRLSPFLSLRSEQELEPPVPPGLAQLSPALLSFAEFLCIDLSLIDAAAKTSPALEETTPTSHDLQTWLATLSANEKETLLATILEGSMKGDHTPAIQLVHSFNKIRQLQAVKPDKLIKQRTIAELLKG